MSKVNYGYKRTVVGAHYGLRDWLVQRMTGLVMAVFTIVLLVQVMLAPGPLGYHAWAAIFSAQWMRFLTYVVILALAWHAWVGMRDIWMDYVKPAALRLLLEALSIVWLAGCAGWGLQVLWRL
jgi:succinate dehydrogenase / fumarate reductase membrane anchor subunit